MNNANDGGAITKAARLVLETFKKDEAQGYQSRDRKFAIDVLEQAFAVYQPPDEHLKDAREALTAAKHFIENGVELGFIRMPSSGDPALDTLPKIEAALEKLGSAR